MEIEYCVFIRRLIWQRHRDYWCVVDIDHRDGEGFGRAQPSRVGRSHFDGQATDIPIGGRAAESARCCVEGQPRGQCRAVGQCGAVAQHIANVDVGKSAIRDDEGKSLIFRRGLVRKRRRQQRCVVDVGHSQVEHLFRDQAEAVRRDYLNAHGTHIAIRGDTAKSLHLGVKRQPTR